MPDEMPFRVGDLVTRDGSDVQRVTRADDGYGAIDVVCIKAPLGWLNEDGTRSEPWCKAGDVESNLASRYSYSGDIIDGDATTIRGRLPQPGAPGQ